MDRREFMASAAAVGLTIAAVNEADVQVAKPKEKPKVDIGEIITIDLDKGSSVELIIEPVDPFGGSREFSVVYHGAREFLSLMLEYTYVHREVRVVSEQWGIDEKAMITQASYSIHGHEMMEVRLELRGPI